MTRIAHTGLKATSLSIIQQHLTISAVEFVDVPEDELQNYLLTHPAQQEVLLIGEKLGNPIKAAQASYALDNQLSIIIINDENSYHRIKQALLFTPFIGNSVQCVSNSLKQGLAAVTQNSILRTQQRRSYARLQGSAIQSTPKAHIYENIKADYLDKFLEGAPIGAVLLSRDGIVLAMNRHASQILQKSEKEVLGSLLSSLFPSSLTEKLDSFLKTDFQEVSYQTFERNCNQQTQYLEIRIAEITANEKLKYKIGIISDHTDKVISRQRIEQQLKELEQANKSLKRVNSDLDTFVYTASHDLKAPISNIEGLINLLEKRVDTSLPQFESIFSMIKVSINRFQDTIKDLTDVALIQKNQESDDAIIDIESIIEEVKSLIRGMIVSSGAKIWIEAENCPQIRFSRTNFRSIIYNLLTNAIKYCSPERAPEIRISAEGVENGIVLLVQDNGLGFSADKKEKIFTMFKRLHTHIEGTGIGLFIVKRIIDNTGGKIEVESTPGQGTTFKILLKQQPVNPTPPLTTP